MTKTAVSDCSSGSLNFSSSYSQGNEDSALKKFLNTFLKHLLGGKENNWLKLCQNYVEPFLAFVNSRIPFQVSLLELSLAQMSLRNHDDSSPKSIRELLEDSRRNNHSTEDSQDTVLRYHSDQQSEISANMLQMARALKTQSLAANSIIKRDVQTLEKAKASAEQNASALKESSNKLATCSKDSMNWCLVILVVVVLMIFINMVLFMKIMKKN